MRKEVLCILGVLLGSAWAQAQQGPSGPASPASDQGALQTGQTIPTSANDMWAAAVGYWGNGSYYDPSTSAYAQTNPGYDPAAYGYNTGYGYNPAYANGYNAGYGYGNGYAEGVNANAGYAYQPGMQGGTGVAQAAPSEAAPQGASGVTQTQSSFQVPQGGPIPSGAPVTVGEVPVGPALPVEGAPVATGGVAPNSGVAWFGVEYLLGSFSKQRLSTPLVTVGSAADMRPGALGQPGTAVVFGQDNLDYGARHGIKAEGGIFLDSDRVVSVEGNGFIFFSNHITSTLASDDMGNPVIARPLFSTLSGGQTRLQTSDPGFISGATQVDARNQFWGFEANADYHCRVGSCFDASFLGGFRFARLDERLTISDRVNPLVDDNLSFLGSPGFPGAPASAMFVNAPNFLTDMDSFTTSNAFYGLNLGSRLRWQYDWFFINAYGKVALGVTDQKVQIAGSTTLVTPAGNTTVPGGVLALPSNIGSYKRTVFGVVPEAGVTLGVEPVRHVRLLAGYSFLYWNAVARPGAQIDPRVNPSQIPTAVQFGTSNAGSSPRFSFADQSFHVHLLNVGLELYY